MPWRFCDFAISLLKFIYCLWLRYDTAVDDLVGDYMRSGIPEDVISSNNDLVDNLVDDLVGDYMRSVIPEDVISSNNDHKGWFQFFSVPFIHSPVLQIARPARAF